MQLYVLEEAVGRVGGREAALADGTLGAVMGLDVTPDVHLAQPRPETGPAHGARRALGRHPAHARRHAATHTPALAETHGADEMIARYKTRNYLTRGLNYR